MQGVDRMMTKSVVDQPAFRAVAEAFNEWMREYIDEPEKFEAHARSILEFVGADITGEEPSYGTSCALTLLGYIEKTQRPIEDPVLGLLILETA